MRSYLKISLAVIVLVLIIQLVSLGESDAKKIKLKDLKKVKKYAYLFAHQRKKLYAIPFPVPLPVLVKRQQIYTQVPIIPRYVQKPMTYEQHQALSYPENQNDLGTHDSPYPMSSMTSYDIRPNLNQQQQPYKRRRPNDYRYIKQLQQSNSLSQLMGAKSMLPLTPAKYISQLASVFNQVYPAWDNEHSREIFSKLLSGQAKMMIPSQIQLGSLVFTTNKHADKGQDSDENKNESNDHQNNSTSVSSSSSSSQDQSVNKPSASELYMSALRPVLDYGLDPIYRIRSPRFVQLAPMKPFYPKAIPLLHPHMASSAANAIMSLVEPQTVSASNQVESVETNHDPHGAGPVVPVIPIGDTYQDRLVQAVHRARQLEASQRLALVRTTLEREKQARLLEVNPILLAAAASNQFSAPILPSQLRLLNY